MCLPEKGIAFEHDGGQLEDYESIKQAQSAVGITIDGHAVREVPGPTGLPYVG